MVERRSVIPHYFDYGEIKNLEVYGQKEPKRIDLNKIGCSLALFHGKYDQIVSKEDFEALRTQIPKARIVFFKNDYDIDHMGFLTSKNQEHMKDLIKILK